MNIRSIDNIRKFLIINSIVAISLVIITVVSLLFAFRSASTIVNESRKYLYAINTQGDIIPMEWVNRRENIEIELKSHLQYFVKSFYGLNLQKWEKNINKALYLGDFEKVHTNRLNEGYYNKFIQFDVRQEAELYPENIEVTTSGEPFHFRILIVVKESYRNETRTFNIFAKGTIKLTDRNFPWNPHGLLIENYLEEEIIRIEK